MAIHFAQNRWDNLKTVYQKWHTGALGRPVIPVNVIAHDPGRPCPKAPRLTQATCHDFSIPAAELIDRLDWELSQMEFLGDAFPYINLNSFGPGVLAAFLGATLDNSTGRVWFHPSDRRELESIHLQFDEGSPWLQRITSICRAAINRWGDQVVLGMPDLGGTLDILSTFRPGEGLLLDLYDHPDEIKRLTNEIHNAWFFSYTYFIELFGNRIHGYTDWSSIFQRDPGYIVQCDFAYMISTKMFDEYVLPDLTKTFDRIDRGFYHLDGVGQLPHLASILKIPTLAGVQWVPGQGKPDNSQWPDVYKQIADAGKLIQIYGNLDTLEAAAMPSGFPERFHLHQVFGSTHNHESITSIRKRLERFGI